SKVRKVEILAQVGDIPTNLERARHQLTDSPVGDVILGGELILENDVKGPARGKFRHLLLLLNFGSCIGMPVAVWNEVQHAVFFFHGDADYFSPLDQERALAVASRLGAVLERSHLDERMEAFQRLSLQGQLTTALAHEVNNKLSTIEMDLDGVLEDFQSLTRQPRSEEGWTEIYQDLERLAELSRQTLDAVTLFQRLMRGDEPRVLGVNRVVRDVVEQLEPLGLRHSIRLKTTLLPELPMCWGLEPRLRQACHNIILNAIQQISRKTATGGWVIVRTFYEPHDERPVKISFRDDGPGIHRRDFERVFDMGYSTRGQEGTGLGLYVTRGLIEAMGGRVYVAESYVLIGTTFLIELPVVEPVQYESD
ncbi:MAG: HAMP domain-containing sensor histidine kinase, partial [Anaerolineae bacterium]